MNCRHCGQPIQQRRWFGVAAWIHADTNEMSCHHTTYAEPERGNDD